MAVKVYLVDKHWEADARAWVVKDRREAQMIVYPVKELGRPDLPVFGSQKTGRRAEDIFARNPAET